MNKRVQLSLLLTIVGLFLATSVWGDYNPCNIAPASPQGVGSSTASFSWSTADNGNVVVTIAPGEGTTTATFRHNGFTGNVDQFKVLSGEGFATEENASKYFYEKENVSGETYTLYRTGNYNLPSPCKIKYYHGALEWATTVGEDVNDNAYDNSSDYVYEYGTLCGSTLDAPEVSVNSNGEVSFNAVEGADSYKAYVYKGGEFIKKCPVSSGDKVYNPFLSGEYAIYVRAFNSSTDAYSDFSNAAIWDAIGDPAGDMPKSTVCDFQLGTGNAEAYLSLTTDRSTGNFVISVRAGETGDDSKTFFRDRRGMDIDGFRYDGETFTDYFNIVYSESDVDGKLNMVYYTPRTDEGHIPEYGHTITFLAGNWVTWRTYINGESHNNASNGLSTFTYTYGANCNEIDDHVAASIDVAVVSTTTTSATLQIDVTDVNDYSEARAIRSLTIKDIDHSIAEQKAVLDGSNQITLSDLKKNTTYNFTVKAIDSGGNVTEETIKVPLTFDVTENLAYKRTCSAGGAADPATQANDGNKDSHWGTYNLGDYGTKNYWMVTLDEAYVLNKMSLYAGGYGGGAAHKVTLQGKMREEDAWSDIITDMTVAGGSEHENIAINAAAKYLKVSASADENWMFAIDEFEVYGTNYAAPDAAAPTVAVTCPAKTITSATLQIIAADKDDAGNAGTIRAINISGDNDFVTQNNVTLDGSNQITLSGLKDNTTYTFTVTAIDRAGNSTSENIVVELPFNTDLNICLGKTATDGYHQGNYAASRAIDGVYGTDNADSKWNTWEVSTSTHGYDDNWMRVDLGAAYNLRNVTMSFDWHYGNPVTEYAIEGSLDDSNWYLIDHVTNQSETSASLSVSAPAQYVRFRAITQQSLGIYEFEVYASGFSTLTDSKPVVTYAKVGEVTDATAEIEIDAVDITTMPITTYMVSGLGGDPVEVTASEGKINLTSLSQSTNYSISIQAKDGNGNLSDAKDLAFTTAGGVSGLYCFAEFFGWGDKAQDRARFSTTAEPNVLRLAVANLATGDHNFKLYNADADRCTYGVCAGLSDHHFNLASATDVTFYATDEDHFVCTADNLYLRGTLVGDDKALVWNDAHTKATWSGTVDLSGTKQYTLVKNNGSSFIYDHDIYDAAQTYDGELTDVTFTFDATKMTGTWSEHAYPVTLDETIDNSTTISNNNGRLADVTLNRGFVADGGNYTLCLPFNMTAEQCAEAFHDGYQLWYLEDSRLKDNGDIYLNFISADNIVAGRPYLFCPASDVASGTVISNVQIDSEASKVSSSTYASFIGTYDVIAYNVIANTTNAYLLGSDNWLFEASELNSAYNLKALRAYFTLNFQSLSVQGRRPRAMVVFNEPRTDMPTDVEEVEQVTAPAKRIVNGQLIIEKNGVLYNAQGKRLH